MYCTIGIEWFSCAPDSSTHIVVVFDKGGMTAQYIHMLQKYSTDEMCIGCCNSMRRHGSGQEKNCVLLPLKLCTFAYYKGWSGNETVYVVMLVP